MSTSKFDSSKLVEKCYKTHVYKRGKYSIYKGTEHFVRRYNESYTFLTNGETINSTNHFTPIDIKDLIFYEQIGCGCFGSVYRGGLRLGLKETPVAIKQLNCETGKNEEAIKKEAELMRSLKSPYIIKLMGMCFSKTAGLMIVLELARLGPLHKYLRFHKEMTMAKIIKLCFQVACAMKYLSSKNLVHRDLAARNVLLVSQDMAKLSDFGMSRRMNEDKYYETHSQGKWPLKWYPPDVIHSGKFDEKSDVWSFGVTCWEATSYGERPYNGQDITGLLMSLDKGERLERPIECPNQMYKLMLRCWSMTKTMRPSFKEIVDEMKMILNDVYQINLDH